MFTVATSLFKARIAILFAMMAAFFLDANAQTNFDAGTIRVAAMNFSLAPNHAISTGKNKIVLALDSTNLPVPFCQSAVKQSSAPALLGPNPKIPYFTVRFAMPIPPENATNKIAALTGMDPNVFTHNHSPGFEILPNGDALAIYFSTPPGESESATTTTFIQARLRYGAVEWDMPELFLDFKNLNDQSGLLWRDGNKIWFFGGGRGVSDWLPFKIATSTDNGATWKLSLPQLSSPATNFTAQPITSAFRSGIGFQPVQNMTGKMPVLLPLYFAMDGHGAHSFLWRSDDDGIHWKQMEGRTGGRHSQIVPLDDKGDLLSIGGKNASVNGWSPENVSTNFGASWSASKASPFPPLGSGQRPSMIRLADGNLFFVSDAYLNKIGRVPPPGWKYGNGCFVAISTNNGISWHIKSLPVQLPNHARGTNGTLGYVTAAQAPNGVIHILTTETQPCLHCELNEAWIFSDAGDIAPENSGGIVKKFSENYPNGKLRSKWSARICPNGRYLLDGKETDFYESGAKEHEVIYKDGRKTGAEAFWLPDGKKLWSWSHDLKNNTATWIHYWSNGKKRIESNWNTKPMARDLARSFFGYVANGPVYQWNEDGRLAHIYNFTNGYFAGEQPLTHAHELH